MTTESNIEKEIQEKGLDAPRLTPADIDAVIVDESFTVLPSGKSMICEILLRNGFTVRGESSCVSKENFDLEIGKNISREDARNKIWGFEGYLLQERLFVGENIGTGLDLEQIAKVCHEVNKGYCEALGDNSQVSWSECPEWQRESARMGADLHLMGDFGPESSHVSWMRQKLQDGWKYGPVKDESIKEHPCIVPFADLPVEQQAKDYIFMSVVHALKNIFA